MVIYILKDPISLQVRYVGKANNLLQRKNQHFNTNKSDSNPHKNNWIKKLKEQFLLPIVESIEEVYEDNWKEREQYWIAFYKDQGCKLVNIVGGGEGLTFGNSGSFKSGHNKRMIVGLDKKTGILTYDCDYVNQPKEILGIKGVHSVLAKITKTAHGFIWLYKEDYLKLTKGQLKKIIKTANDNSKKGLGSRFSEGRIPWNKNKTYKRHGKNNSCIGQN